MKFPKAVVAILLGSISFFARSDVVTGTGFFVSADGYFATNWHVVEDANEIFVQDQSGSRHVAIVAGSDPANDLAILRISEKSPAWLPIIESSSTVRRGTEVITVGYPHLLLQGSEPKITNGIINSLSGIKDDPRMFQISVPVQPGNSGGALVTTDGLVIGVVTSKLSASATLQSSGSLPENVNYAVKSNYLLELLRSHNVRAKIEVRPIGKELKLIDLAARVERATGLVIGWNKQVRRNSEEAQRELERYCQHERKYQSEAAYEKCAQEVIARLNKSPK